jgi:hypothetical protein
MQIQVCPHCSTRMVPSSDGKCVACRFGLSEKITAEDKHRLESQKRRPSGEDAFASPTESDQAKRFLKRFIATCLAVYALIGATNVPDALMLFFSEPGSYTAANLSASAVPTLLGSAFSILLFRSARHV